MECGKSDVCEFQVTPLERREGMPLPLPAGDTVDVVESFPDHVSGGHTLQMAEQQDGRRLGPDGHSCHPKSAFCFREKWTSTMMFRTLLDEVSVNLSQLYILNNMPARLRGALSSPGSWSSISPSCWSSDEGHLLSTVWTLSSYPRGTSRSIIMATVAWVLADLVFRVLPSPLLLQPSFPHCWSNLVPVATLRLRQSLGLITLDLVLSI